MKFHLKMWSLLSGMTLSLALIGGCNSEEAAPTDKPAETTSTKPADPATEAAPATTPAPSPTETPAIEPAKPAETAPAPEKPAPAPEEKPKEEAK